MAVLGKIREKSIILILIIALALFAFVMTGVFKNLGGPEGPSDNIATIDGEDVSRTEFAQRVENYESNSRRNISTTQAVNQVWNSTLQSVLLEKQFEDLGLEIGDEQLNDVIRQQFAGNPAFQNEAGMFDINRFRQNIANLKSAAPQRYQQFKSMEANMVRQAKANAYFNLVQAGIKSSNAEARQVFKMENDNVSFDFVMLPYSQASDVNVSKADIKSYMNDHKDRFQDEKSRNIQYVLFEEKPSATDADNTKEQLNKLMGDRQEYDRSSQGQATVKGFRNTTDYEAFLVQNSDLPFTNKYLFKDQISSKIPDSLSDMSKGKVYGPYKENNYWKYTKVADMKKLPDSVEAKRILIAFQGNQTRQQNQVSRSRAEAKKLADSLVNVIQQDTAQFANLATQYSDDPRVAQNGGDMGWVNYRNIPNDSEISDFLFNTEVGKAGVIESPYGYQLLLIKDKKNEQQAVKLATLAREIKPSEKTLGNLFTQTIKFQKSLDGDQKFSDAAQKFNQDVRTVNRIEEMQANIPGAGNQRQVVQWAFNKNTATGDVKRFETADGYIIAQLTAKNKAGMTSVENASAKVTPILRKQKQAEMLKDKLQGNSLNSIASSVNQTVQSAQAVNLKSPTIAGVGSEPKVVGTAFALEVGKLSKPIAGNNGVFTIKVTNKKDAQELDNYRAFAQQKDRQQNQQMRNQLFEALKNNAEIEDNRSEFY